MGNEVSVKITADNTQATSGIKKTENAVSEFKKNSEDSLEQLSGKFAKVFAGVAAVMEIKEITEEFSHIADLAKRMGESAESVQRLSHAAKQSGTDIDMLAKAFTKADINAIGAMKGNKELQDAFDALGLSAGEFVDMPMEEKLLAIADGYEKGGSQAEMMDSVIKILGKSGAEVLPILAQGGEEIRKQFQEAAIVTDAEVARLKAAGDRMETLWEKMKAKAASFLDSTIRGFQYLEIGIGTAWKYVTNLGSGFHAAAEAAGEFNRAAMDWMKNGDGGAGKNGKKTSVEEVEAEAAARKEQQDAEKKAEDELAKLKAENDKKAEEARIAALASKQREKEIQIEIGALEGRQRDISNLSDQEKEEMRGKLLDYYKELKTVQDKIAADALKAAQDEKKAQDDAKRTAKEIADHFDKIGKGIQKAFKEVADEDLKKKLQEAEDKLSALESSSSSFSIDSLRQIGGGLSGVNYQSALHKVDAQQKAIDLQKQAVEHLKNIQRQLEKGDRTDLGDGSFAIS